MVCKKCHHEIGDEPVCPYCSAADFSDYHPEAAGEGGVYTVVKVRDQDAAPSQTEQPYVRAQDKPRSAAAITVISALLAISVFLIRNLNLCIMTGMGIPVVISVPIGCIIIAAITFLICKFNRKAMMVINTIIVCLIPVTVLFVSTKLTLDYYHELHASVVSVSVMFAFVIGIGCAELSRRQRIESKSVSRLIELTYLALFVFSYVYFVYAEHFHYSLEDGRETSFTGKFSPLHLLVFAAAIGAYLLAKFIPKSEAVLCTVAVVLICMLVVLGLDWYCKINLFPHELAGQHKCYSALNMTGGFCGALIFGVMLARVLPMQSKVQTAR